MALETATYISQLVATNPVPGDSVGQADDHLNLIKRVLQAQFTSLGATAVVRTAAELNAVTSKLTAFNGRSVVDVVPTEGDYNLPQMGDVDNGVLPTLGNVLTGNGSAWVSSAPGSGLSGKAHYDTYAGRSGDSPYFGFERAKTIPAGLADIKNTSGSGIGWQLTATVKCLVSITYSQVQSDTIGRTSYVLGIGFNSATNAIPAAGAERVAYSFYDKFSAAPDRVTQTVTASVILEAAETLTLFYDDNSGGYGIDTLSSTVSVAAQSI